MVHIAFICHCNTKHGDVLFHQNNIDLQVDFIDPWSGCKNWDQIDDDSIDVFYTIGCPVYYPFFDKQFNKYTSPKAYKELLQEYHETKQAVLKEMKDDNINSKEIMDSLFEDGFNKLKNKGQLVIPINFFGSSNKHIPDNFIAFVKQAYPQVEFTYQVKNTVPYEYTITWDSDYGREHNAKPQDHTFDNPNTQFLILTKQNSRIQFHEDLNSLGKDQFLQRFLTQHQFMNRRLSSQEMIQLLNRVQSVYPNTTKEDVVSLFTTTKPYSHHVFSINP